MVLVDTNVWLALSLSKHPFHVPAKDWLSGQIADGSVLFCRATQQSFLRLLTTESVVRPFGVTPSNADAWAVYNGIRADGRVGFATEPQGLEARWQQLTTRGSASPKLWMDAYLAAFALAGEGELVTTDKAFKQFDGLKVTVLAQGRV